MCSLGIVLFELEHNAEHIHISTRGDINEYEQHRSKKSNGNGTN